MTEAFGIDIGGTGMKGAIVDVDTGDIVGERYRVPTPHPAVPGAMVDIVAGILSHHGWSARFGVALPSVVKKGVVLSAANIDSSWIGVDAAALFRERTGCEVTVLNDADAAGVAEMRFGAGRGRGGVVVLLTFGTGIGSALFVDGQLVPNTEFGHFEFRGRDAEQVASAKAREDRAISMDEWLEDVQAYLSRVEVLLSPDLIIFGGGISKQADQFLGRLRTRADLVAARFRNNAGIVGAALASS